MNPYRSIYCVYLINDPNANLSDPDCRPQFMGFYNDRWSAQQALHKDYVNFPHWSCQLGGFIVERWPGIDFGVSSKERAFFLWNEEKQGYYAAPEPEHMRNAKMSVCGWSYGYVWPESGVCATVELGG